jgi:hypothetical protein
MDWFYLSIRNFQSPRGEHIEDYVLASCTDLVNSLNTLSEKRLENTPIYTRSSEMNNFTHAHSGSQHQDVNTL